MNIWVVSREYAGIAEAGGVKNVTCSLSESLASLGHKVTVFIPLYACTDLKRIDSFSCVWRKPLKISVSQKEFLLTYSHGFYNNVEFVFVGNKCFSEKMSVYTYTAEEEKIDSKHKKGEGHVDANFLNVFFQKAVASYYENCTASEIPLIVHCQDATSALVPSFISYLSKTNAEAKKFYENTKCVITIHNAGPGYHHEYKTLEEARGFTMLPADFLKDGLCEGRIEPFLLSSKYAALTAVSKEYAQEILSQKTETQGLGKEFSNRNVKIYGITNGIDYEKYDPSNTKNSSLPYEFNPLENDLEGKYQNRKYFLDNFAALASKNLPSGIERLGFLNADYKNDIFIASHSRIVAQKGIDVMAKAAAVLMKSHSRLKFIFMGQGDPVLEKMLEKLSAEFPGQCVYFRGYDKMLSRLCITSADFSLHSSYFEPCGLEDFISQIYGTIPVANATGGLCKIIDGSTGFLYSPNESAVLVKLIESLVEKLKASPEFFDRMRKRACVSVKEKYNWKYVTQNYYIPLYEEITGKS